MKVIKTQLGVPTDTKAFKGRESFKSGLKISISEIDSLSDNEYNNIANDLRKYKGHIISNLLSRLDEPALCGLPLKNERSLMVLLCNSKVTLFILDNHACLLTQKISVNEAKLILKNEAQVLFMLNNTFFLNKYSLNQQNITDIVTAANQNIITKEILIEGVSYTIDDDFDLDI